LNISEYAKLDALGLAGEIRAGEVSAEEVAAVAVDAAKSLNPTLNALIDERYEQAIEDSKRMSGSRLFEGVPFLIKDCFTPFEGGPDYQGNAELKALNRRAPKDCYLVEKFKDSGLNTIGFSHAPEFACGMSPITAETAAFGACRNPYNLAHTPMGSSGGSASAVAAGIVPIAHGNDGGGSIRMPAGACGLVGLKPTRGRASFGPIAGEVWGGFSNNGVLTRTVRDTAAALDVISGPMTGDPYFASPPASPYLQAIEEEPGPLKIGFCAEAPGGVLHPDCEAAVLHTAKILESLGHEVVNAFPEYLQADEINPAIALVVAAQTANTLKNYEGVLGRAWKEEDMESGSWNQFQMGLGIAAEEYIQAQSTLSDYTRRFARWWDSGFDILVTPVLAAPPPPIGYLVDPAESTNRLLQILRYTMQFNVTGQPAISLPLYTGQDELPIGVQFGAPYGDEKTLLKLAKQLEEAAPWKDKRPSCFVG